MGHNFSTEFSPTKVHPPHYISGLMAGQVQLLDVCQVLPFLALMALAMQCQTLRWQCSAVRMCMYVCVMWVGNAMAQARERLTSQTVL